MSSIYPVTRARHTAQRWQRFDHYGFAASAGLAPLTIGEVTKAAISLPLAFIEREGGWMLAAVLGLQPSQNLYVGSSGQWIASYVPATFRSYPFRVGWSAATEPVLCVDESASPPRGVEGEAYFDEAGNLSSTVAQVWAFLQETVRGEAVLAQACGLLHEAGVIAPWPVTVSGDGGDQAVTGLHRIDEAALNGLDDVAYGTLRRAGVIGLAYAQLLSTANLADLGGLAQARAEAEAVERAKAEVKPMIMLPEDSSIDWDWSKIGKS